MSGATTATLTLSNLLAGDAGAYSVVISNTWGSVTSKNALLSVNSATLVVKASANIFGAGQSLPPNPAGGSGGVLPAGYSFAAGPRQLLTFSSITGQATLTEAYGLFGADGNIGLPTLINSFGGISGIQANASGFLVGVFLGPGKPTNPAPPILNFDSAGLSTSFPFLSPEIAQTFFIGDGL